MSSWCLITEQLSVTGDQAAAYLVIEVTQSNGVYIIAGWLSVEENRTKNIRKKKKQNKKSVACHYQESVSLLTTTNLLLKVSEVWLN